MARVLLCVGGGISAYKAPELVRDLIREGHEVQVVMTDAAAAFVTELSLGTVSKRPVRRTLLDASAEGQVGHIEMADWAELVLVAPATANLMAKAANGIADDLVTTVLLATKAPILWAPAMNSNMWSHAATRRNLERLIADGGRFIGPDRGDLACGWIGEGRMMDPPLIAEAATRELHAVAPGEWSTRHIVVSAGPTRAYLDPVRFVSNASTGAMGVAIAQAALDLGARVTLVAGPLQVSGPRGARLERVDIETAEEMYDALRSALAQGSVDALAMVAAVADFRPGEVAADKLGKGDARERLASVEWTKERDLLASLTEEFADDVYFLGFAAQTVAASSEAEVEAALLAYAKDKVERKGADAIFVNRVGVEDTGFGTPTNAGWWTSGRGEAFAAQPSGAPRPKAELARWLLDRVGEGLRARNG